MELRHLRYFVAVAEELSFTRAAEKLRLAQPSLTRQIHNLETELGVRLLDRTRNQVSLTLEGKQFLKDSQRLISMSLESVRSIKRLSKAEGAVLNIGYHFKFNFDILPTTLAAFYDECPGVAVNLFDLSPESQLSALQARKIDLAFIGLRPPADHKIARDLSWECVTRHEVMVALPSSHSLASKGRMEMADLTSEFFVVMSEETHPGSREWLCSLCRRSGFTPRILQETLFEAGLMTFVAEGFGVTLVRNQARHLPHPGVTLVPLSTENRAEYWIAWNPDSMTCGLKAFVEVLKKSQNAASPSPQS